MNRDPEVQRLRDELEELLEAQAKDAQRAQRRSRFVHDWAPYAVFAVFIVMMTFFISWCGDQKEQACRKKGGDHIINTGRYRSTCVSADGRIVE